MIPPARLPQRVEQDPVTGLERPRAGTPRSLQLGAADGAGVGQAPADAVAEVLGVDMGHAQHGDLVRAVTADVAGRRRRQRLPGGLR